MILIDRSDASHSTPTGYRLQVTGYRLKQLFSLQGIYRALGANPPTQHKLLRADWVKTRKRSLIFLGDWFGDISQVTGLSIRHMGGLVPQISHLATQRLAYHRAKASIHCWSLHYTHLCRSLARPQSPNSWSREASQAATLDCLGEVCQKSFSLFKALRFAALVTKLPCTTFAILTHSDPFTAFLSVLTLLIHWTGASRVYRVHSLLRGNARHEPVRSVCSESPTQFYAEDVTHPHHPVQPSPPVWCSLCTGEYCVNLGLSRSGPEVRSR